MSFSVEEKLPGNYFQEVMSTQTEMVRMYLDDLDHPLIFSQYCGNTMATFKFYSCNDDNASNLLHCTFSNLGDLKDQLYYFWVQLIGLMQSEKTFLMSTSKHVGVQIFRFTWVKLKNDPPVSNCHNSFTWYTALHSIQLYTVIWCSATGQVSHTFLNSDNISQFQGVVVVLLIAYCCCCELHNNKHNYQININ